MKRPSWPDSRPIDPVSLKPTQRTIGLLIIAVALLAATPGSPPPVVSGLLYPGEAYLAGRRPVSVAIADINHDGQQDVVLANFGNDFYGYLVGDGISVLLGRQDGTFSEAMSFDAGYRPTEVVLADFDVDGHLDAAVAGYLESGVSVLRGDGTGHFEPAIHTWFLSSPLSLTTGDFNEDGLPDLVVSNHLWNHVIVLIGQGDGTFHELPSLPIGNTPRDVAVADLDNDGHQDLAVADYGVCTGYPICSLVERGEIFVLRGDGSGGFSAPAAIPQLDDLANLEFVRDVAVTDFDGDDEEDLLANAIMAGDHGFIVVPGHGDGTFGTPTPFSEPQYSEAIATGDLDMDGLADVVALHDPGGEIDLLVFPGSADFSLSLSQRFEASRDANSGGVAEFNSDGRNDLIVVTDRILGESLARPYLGRGDGTLAALVRTDGYIDGFAGGADFSGDGLTDLVSYLTRPGEVAILLSQGDGTFAELSRTSVGHDIFVIDMGDFNSDGEIDVVAAGRHPGGTISILLGIGTGAFEVQPQIPALGGVQALAAGDFDSDGLDDVAVLHYCADLFCMEGRLAVHLSNGDGTFQAPRDMPLGARPGYAMESGDFDDDGVDDLVYINEYPAAVQVLMGTGNGGFTPGFSHSEHGHSVTLAVGDLDGDEIADIVNFGNAFLSNGDGTFRGRFLPIGNNDALAIADIDADGIADIARAGPNSPSIVILPGLGDGYYGQYRLIESWNLFNEIVAGDFDGDQRIDLVQPGFSQITAFLNIDGFPDTDGDGIPDNEDDCTDSDGDGFGDPDITYSDCQDDNCPDHANLDQFDADDDGRGDVCDPCPLDPLDDPDADGVCNTADNCPAAGNPGQADGDGDGVGDVCDNCPEVTNHDQADETGDGSGDACQPTLEIVSLDNPDVDTITVSLTVTDPQGEPFLGTAAVIGPDPGFTIGNIYQTRDCNDAYILAPGAGIMYLNRRSLSQLRDLNSLFNCGDGQQDYWIVEGTCQNPMLEVYGSTYSVLDLSYLNLPASICIGEFPNLTPILDATILEYNSEYIRISLNAEATVIEVPFSGALPQSIDISQLGPGVSYRLLLTGTDGSTRAVDDSITFLYGGESQLILAAANRPPEAIINAPALVECDRLSAGGLILDGSSSLDPDSTPGTSDDIVLYEWFEILADATEQPLGTGPTLPLVLPLGNHTVGLRVTDSQDESDTALTEIVVRDTTPPMPVCVDPPSVECSGPSGADVNLVATATDVCSPIVVITNDQNPGGADASGVYPLGTTIVGFTATDESGNMATCASTVVVKDETPPAFSLAADPTELWPPNHRMAEVDLSWTVEDVCDAGPNVLLLNVTSSEPDDAPDDGDGATTGDLGAWSPGTPQTTFTLRAERSGNGPGRVYQLSYEATDASGNTTPAVAIVTVPHDQGEGPEPLLMQLQPDGAPERVHIYWPGLPGLLGYDLIVGDLSRVAVVDRYLTLDAVQVLARGTPGTEVREATGTVAPPAGGALIYLLQQRDSRGGAGYGTATAPWPRLPLNCEDGCP